MNEFVEMQEQSTGSDPHKKPPTQTQQIQLRNHYNDLESQLSSNLQEVSLEQNPTNAVQMQEVQKEGPKFKLVLPSMPEPDTPQQGNNNAKNKRVLIEPSPPSILKQSSTAEKLKIYDLQDEIQEQIIENTQYSSIPNKPERVIYHQEINQVSHEPNQQDNSFLDVKEDVKVNMKLPQKQPEQKINKINGLTDEYQNSRLFSKVYIKQAPITKGAFVQKAPQNEEYLYMYPDSSKQSLDSGLQVTSVYSSRDELSTRNILLPSVVEKSKRYKLPELRPYKQVLEDKVYQMPSQTLLKEEQPAQKPTTPVKKKNKTEMTRSRQVVINSNQITNIPLFVKSPVPYGRRLECTLVRNKSCSKRFFLDYDLITADGKFLMSCKKMTNCLTSAYNISLANGSYDERSEFFLGKVNGNFVGSLFNLYTYNTDSFEEMDMVATIYYSSSFSCCSDKCRGLEIYLKNKDIRYFQLEGTELQKGKNLKDLYEIEGNRSFKRISKYVNKQPKWVPQLEMYSLNFHRKAKYASVKNTVIIKEGKPESEMLLIAKHSRDQFSFEISYPFSPLIALGVMITGFDFKLASQ